MNFNHFRSKGIKIEWDEYLLYRGNVSGNFYDANLSRRQLEITNDFAKRGVDVQTDLVRNIDSSNLNLSDFTTNDLKNIANISTGSSGGVPLNPKNVKNVTGDVSKLDLTQQEWDDLVRNLNEGKQFDVDVYINISLNSPRIKNVNTYFDELIGTFKRDDQTIWLERGFIEPYENAYGMEHIWDRHHPNGDKITGEGSQFPESFSEDDITLVIDDIISNGSRQPSNSQYPGQFALEDEIDFGSTTEIVRVTLTDNGRILSAFPLNDV